MAGERKFKIEKHPLYREEIKEALTQAIVSGELQPGDRVVETRWARELGVSQSPIREAIRELELTGLVENIPYKGCIVRKITEKDLMDIYEVRGALESLAISEAVAVEDKSFLEEMKVFMARMRESAAIGDAKQFIIADVEFHKVLIERSKNEMLKRLWKQCSILDNTRVSTLLTRETLTELAERHQALINVIEAGDQEKAKAEINEHFRLLCAGMKIS